MIKIYTKNKQVLQWNLFPSLYILRWVHFFNQIYAYLFFIITDGEYWKVEDLGNNYGHILFGYVPIHIENLNHEQINSSKYA